MLGCVGSPGRVSILLLRYTNKVLHPSLVLCLGPSSIFVRSTQNPLNNCIIGSKGQWSWCINVSFTYGLLQRVQLGSGNSFYLYLVSFVPQKPDTFFTIQSCKRWDTLAIMCSNYFQSTRSKVFCSHISVVSGWLRQATSRSISSYVIAQISGLLRSYRSMCDCPCF